jgi:hypothetical protein
MYKLFKIPVTGIEGSEDIGINTSVRTTIGYSAANKEITVLVEKIVLPEVPTTESVDLRINHTEATFQTLLERTFTPADFPKTSDCIRWVVDYDVTKNEIVGPFNALEYTKTHATNSFSHRLIPRIIKQRYNLNLIPLFALDNFFKSAQDFDNSVLSVYTDNQGLEINDTILTGDLASAEEVDQAAATQYTYRFTYPHVHYEILNDAGKVISSNLPFIKSEAKATPFYEQLTVVPGDNSNPSTYTPAYGGDRFKVRLPVADHYNIRAIFETFYDNKMLPFSMDVVCINGSSNKSRLMSAGFDKDRFNAGQETNQNILQYREQHDKGGSNNTLCGVDSLRIATNGLVAGDYIKLKLNAGEFYSYSELWIELI